MSQYLRQELHGLLESASKAQIPEMYAYVKELGGYFKRFSGGLLSPWINSSMECAGEMDLHARATLTFFEVRGLPHEHSLSKNRKILAATGGQKSRGRSCC